MADTIRMKHTFFAHDWTEYFYDGELVVRDGNVEVPADRPEWAQRLWILGFTTSPDGSTIDDILSYIEREKARDAKEIDASEGADAGGLPATEDGVRESTTESSGSLSRRRVGSLRRNSARSRA